MNRPNCLRPLPLRALLALLAPLAFLASCSVVDRRPELIDSLHAVAAKQQELAGQLSAQKDSLTRIVLEADAFISKIDSQISTVKGLPTPKRPQQPLESPIEEQLLARKEMLARVGALVERAKTTAAQLAESRRREQALKGENAKLLEQISQDQKMIADLGATIERQLATITTLEARVDSLATETRTLGERHYRAYYIIGTERELLEKRVVEREGGANLLLVRLGRSLQPARGLDPELFTAIDQRDVREIHVPDTSKRYRIVSRQSLDNAEVRERHKQTFRGNLRIADVEKFWSASRYLILVER